MKHGSDVSVEFDDLIVVHQNLPRRVVSRHQHDMHEIIIPLGGRIKVTPAAHGQTSIAASRGEMVLIPAALEHSYDVTGGDAEQVIVLFAPKWLEHQLQGLTLLQHSVLIAELAILLLFNGEEGDPDAVISTLKHAVRRSVHIAKDHAAIANLSVTIRDERLRKAVAYMEKHLADEAVLTGAAEAAAASQRTLARICKADLGVSPGDLLRKLRMSHAKELLTAGRYSVTEVALECGYQSMSQFINAFKAMTGTLPSQFRKK